MTRTRMGLVLGLLLALALATGACSGGGKGSGVASLGDGKATPTTRAGGSQDERQAALNWARCVRQHGINLPDPRVRGDGIVQQLPDRAERDGPKFKAAQQACRQFQANGGQPSPPSSREVRQALAFARCMRQHGINVPDPRVTGTVSTSSSRRGPARTPRSSGRRSRPAGSTCPRCSVRKAVGVAGERVGTRPGEEQLRHDHPGREPGLAAQADRHRLGGLGASSTTNTRIGPPRR
jgi:hypothetical protein